MKRLFLPAIILLILTAGTAAQDINGYGISDTIVIEFDKNNILFIPKMPTYEAGSEDLTYVSYEDFKKNESISFELSMWSIDGEILGNELIFDLTDNFIIRSVKYKISRALYFNEDGSGGTWPASDEYFSDWRPLNEVDYNIFATPAWNKIVYPVIPEGAIEKAEEEKESNPILDYSEFTGSVVIQIKYTLNNKGYTKELNFEYSYGD